MRVVHVLCILGLDNTCYKSYTQRIEYSYIDRQRVNKLDSGADDGDNSDSVEEHQDGSRGYFGVREEDGYALCRQSLRRRSGSICAVFDLVENMGC